MKRTPNICYGLSALLLSFGLLSCKGEVSQNPKDNFADGKLPRALQVIRSQVREFTLSQRDAIAARTRADQARRDLIEVGVIDSGVDLAHPDLRDQIVYTVKDGKIVGAGADLLGGGAFASYVRVNSSIFAFGAKEIKEGLIVDPPENPLRLIKEINDSFSEALIKQMAKGPLKNSLFSRLKKEDISVIAFEDIRKSTGLGLRRYAEAKRARGLVNAENLKDQPFGVRHDLEVGWAMTPLQSLPAALTHRTSIEHSDLFLKAVEKSYAEINEKLDYDGKKARLLEFINDRTDAPAQESMHEQIAQVIRYLRWGNDAFDPIWLIETHFKQSLDYKDLTLEKASKKYIKRLQEHRDELAAREDLTDADKRLLKSSDEAIRKLDASFKWLIDTKDTPEAYKSMRSLLRRYVHRTQHPYVDQSSATNAHGTHVAGIIARADDRIRIYPMSLLLYQQSTSSGRQNQLAADVGNDFMEWFQLPIVQGMAKNLLGEYQNFNPSGQTLMLKIAEHLKESKNLASFQQIIESIHIAGKRKQKIANMSIGLLMDREFSRNKKLDSFVSALFSEYMRYRIGEAMTKKAPGTLFVVASGNNGALNTGIGRSGLPAGIASPRFFKVATELSIEHSPNNTAENVLAVGSMNAKGTVTHFSNVMANGDPQVFAEGEEVMAPVPHRNMALLNRTIGKFMGGAAQFSGGLYRKLLIEMRDGYLAGGVKEEQIARALSEDGVTASLLSSMRTMVGLFHPVNRDRLSGTSMAAPKVAGLVAIHMLNKADQHQLRSKDARYTSPHLAPKVIREEIINLAKVSNQKDVLSFNLLSEKIKTWAPPANRLHAERLLEQKLAAPGVLCRAVFQ